MNDQWPGETVAGVYLDFRDWREGKRDWQSTRNLYSEQLYSNKPVVPDLLLSPVYNRDLLDRLHQIGIFFTGWQARASSGALQFSQRLNFLCLSSIIFNKYHTCPLYHLMVSKTKRWITPSLSLNSQQKEGKGTSQLRLSLFIGQQ